MADGQGYPPFECAPGLKLRAHERVSQIHHENISRRLDRIEVLMERLEKRLWLTVYGVVAVILAQAVQPLLAQ
ncbi:MAG: GTA head formation protein, RCAP_rcc01685 family [Paracoccaceae bacterium]